MSESPLEVAVAVIARGARILLQLRDYGPYAGYWELPGGKVERGEDPAAAAVREAEEELGTPVATPRFLMTWEHRYPGGPWVRLHAFAVEPVREVPPHSGRRWTTVEEARRLRVLEGTIPILERALA
ncbi:MAG: NUDIX domain-containing protein [Methanobacteriota archaeon]